MTLITGTIRNSAGVALSGRLRVTLDAPTVDLASAPDSVYTTQPHDYTITSGVVNISLLETETRSLTYHFEFYGASTRTDYYLQNGGLYGGPRHLWTDSNYYTGAAHTSESQLLSPQTNTIESLVLDFHAEMPNTASWEFAALIPTGISADTIDTSLRRLAEILTTDPLKVQALRGGPRPQGAYNPTVYYNRDDMVSLDGSSYVYIQTIATAGNQPPNAAYWQVVADRGPTGTGTTGNNTPYNATTWDGQLDAPSRNAVRDVIETLAKLTDIAGLAPLTSPVFGGTPSRSTAPAAGDNSTQLTTTSWVRSYAAPLDSPALLNNPSAPTQPISDRSTKLATTGHVSNKIDAALGAVVIASQSAPVALTSGSWIKIPFDQIQWDPGSQFASGNFTPAATDYYRFTLAVYCSASSAITLANINLYTVSPLANVQLIGLPAVQSGNAAAFYGSADALLTTGTSYAIYVRVDGTSPTIGVTATVPCRLSIQRIRS
jgi:hypothetical protein